MTSASRAIDRLRAGNKRFISGKGHPSVSFNELRAELENGQAPFAAILGCSDSRAAPELIFDQGLGDLFVVRAAGHVATPSQVGSIEFAVENLNVRLVVVLGHSMCGAVEATIEAIESSKEPNSPNLSKLLKTIRPVVESLMESSSTHTEVDLLERSIKSNVLETVHHLRDRSPLLGEHVERAKLLIVGALYSFETGAVEFLEGSASDA